MSLSIELLRASFSKGVISDVLSRKKYLKAMLNMVNDNIKDINDALKTDLNKPNYESWLTEISQVVSEITHLHNNLDSLVADEPVPKSFVFMLDSSYIQRQPFGVCLIIGAWNYPINLTLICLCGALAAGNVVLLKPSELASATEKLLARLIPLYLDDVCKVFCGGPQETSDLLSKNRFDLIFYTGSSRVGKLIMSEAAKNLTPVILELGGKSPVYVDKAVDLELAATRICWAKYLNCGQTCVAPDYILCHEAVYEQFLEAVSQCIIQFYGQDAKQSADYCRIINEGHVQRLQKLIHETKGKIVIGGEVNPGQKFVSPTVVRDVKPDDCLMQDELFGPIMPVLKVRAMEEAVELVRGREKPLALYVFSSRREVAQHWLQHTSSGGFLHNDCSMHLANLHLPFGGVGTSGMGSYHGKYSIEAFSHKRAVLIKSTNRQTDFVRLPPYNDKNEGWARWLMKSKLKEGSGYCSLM